MFCHVFPCFSPIQNQQFLQKAPHIFAPHLDHQPLNAAAPLLKLPAPGEILGFGMRLFRPAVSRFFLHWQSPVALIKGWDFCSTFRISSTSFTICAFHLQRSGYDPSHLWILEESYHIRRAHSLDFRFQECVVRGHPIKPNLGQLRCS